MIIRKLIITRSLSFNIVVQYIQILWTFDYFPVALTTLRSVLPLPLSELFISWMLPECFSLRVLISIKSTMIIDGGHHGIRLYEREVQPHENFCRH